MRNILIVLILINLIQIFQTQNLHPNKIIAKRWTSIIEDNFDINYNSNNTLCLNSVNEIIEGVKNSELWALKYIDSWGKLPPGLLQGHLQEFGNFEECLNIKHSAGSETINGKYCTLQIPAKDILNILPLFSLFEEINGKNNNLANKSISLGICIPSTCSTNYFNKILIEYLQRKLNINLNTTSISNQCFSKPNQGFDMNDWIAIVVFGLIALIMFASSIYNYYCQVTNTIPNDLFNSFSIINNGKKLFQIDKRKSPDIIQCMNGIRSLSIIWIVLGHEYSQSASLNNINPDNIQTWSTSFHSLLITQGAIPVDSFLLLSGFLVAWNTLKEMDKRKGKLNVIMMYLHRYIRLTPVLAASVLFVVSFYRYLGNGPMWSLRFTELCMTNWWSTLLYVQNYVHPTSMCIGHSWYLAVDFQLFILSPLILIPLYKWGKRFIPVVVILGLISIAAILATYILNDYHSLFTEANFSSESITRTKLLYTMTHARYAPWLVGVLLGYSMYQIKNKNINMPRITVLILWTISIVAACSIIWGPYNRLKSNGGKPTVIEGAVHEAFRRISWSITLAWIVFACHKDLGGPINSILSWSIWQPITKLSYSLYIVHFLVILVTAGNVKTNTNYSDFDVIFRFWGDFGLSLCITITSVLAFESPFMNIEKILFKSKPRNVKANISQEDLVADDNRNENKNNNIYQISIHCS